MIYSPFLSDTLHPGRLFICAPRAMTSSANYRRNSLSVSLPSCHLRYSDLHIRIKIKFTYYLFPYYVSNILFTLDPPRSRQHFIDFRSTSQQHFVDFGPTSQQHLINFRPISQKNFIDCRPISQQDFIDFKPTSPVHQLKLT